MICEVCQKKFNISRIEKLLEEADEAMDRMNKYFEKREQEIEGEQNDANNNDTKEKKEEQYSKRKSDAISYPESIGHY